MLISIEQHLPFCKSPPQPQQRPRWKKKKSFSDSCGRCRVALPTMQRDDSAKGLPGQSVTLSPPDPSNRSLSNARVVTRVHAGKCQTLRDDVLQHLPAPPLASRLQAASCLYSTNTRMKCDACFPARTMKIKDLHESFKVKQRKETQEIT